MNELKFYKQFIGKKLHLYDNKDYILKNVRKLESGMILGYFEESCINVKLFSFEGTALDKLYEASLKKIEKTT